MRLGQQFTSESARDPEKAMRIRAEKRSRIHLELVIEVRTIDRQVTWPCSHPEET